MLVIRRRPGESLVIGEDVEIEILDSTSSQVKLGIRAPKSVAVLRKEIHVVGQQNRTASQEISGQAAEKLLASLKKPASKPISPLLKQTGKGFPVQINSRREFMDFDINTNMASLQAQNYLQNDLQFSVANHQ